MSRRSSSAPIARTEAAVKSHRAVNGMFANHTAQQRKTTDDRLSGRTWSTAHSGPVPGGLRSMYTPSQINKLKEEGRFVDVNGSVVDGVPDGDFSRSNTSCYLLNAQKQFHQYGREDPELSKMRLQNVRYSYGDALRAYNKAQSIIRHERTIPKRRIADKYVQLTSAQADLHQDIPNAVAIRNRVRQHEGWTLANPDRQEQLRGKPLMSRVMAGEFYYDDNNLNSLAGDYVAINKKHVRAASAVSRVANAHAPVNVLPEYCAAPQPRRTIATLKTYDSARERALVAQRGRAGATQPQGIPIGHRHFLPHDRTGITAGARVANRVIRTSSCHHDRSMPLYDPSRMGGSHTYVSGMWPPEPTAAKPNTIHESHPRYRDAMTM